MNLMVRAGALVAGFVAFAVLAAAPAGVPSGATGVCKDGSYSFAAERKGACRGHDGVRTWYGTPTQAQASTAASAGAHPEAAETGASAPLPGGAGQVWANTSTKAYHCSGDPFYGKTKEGKYMTEADARQRGYHAQHGRGCS